jgi:hypothetical protein
VRDCSSIIGLLNLRFSKSSAQLLFTDHIHLLFIQCNVRSEPLADHQLLKTSFAHSQPTKERRKTMK